MNEQDFNKSEVARIRQQIDLEIEAVNRVFREPAIVANHEAINHRFAALWSYKEQLDLHMNPRDAAKVVLDALEKLDQQAETHS